MIKLGIGIIIGFFLGAIWMFLFIKSSKVDAVLDRQIEDDIDLEDPWDADSIDDIAKEDDIHYGGF